MKLNVFSSCSICVAKIRIYNDGDGLCAVEFQRRQGDAVAFNKFYQDVSMLFEASPQRSDAAHPFVSFEAPALPKEIVEELEVENLEPLLDLASCSNFALQAEAAVALASLARDKATAPLLCGVPVQRAFDQLLQCDEAVVAYPTAFALRCLAEHAEVATAFVALGLIGSVLSSLLYRQVDEIVQTLLATALSTAVMLSDEQACQEARNQLSHTLRDALGETKLVSSNVAPVYQELGRAHACLAFSVSVSTH